MGLLIAGNLAADPTPFEPLYPGSVPLSGLLLAPDGNYYGTSPYGGANDLGMVFRLTPGGVLQPIYSFTGNNDGANPAAPLALGADNYLYGTTRYGGSNQSGGIFKIDTYGNFQPLALIGGALGAEPAGGMAKSTNNFMFGTTSAGGSNGFGTIFRTGTHTGFASVYSFSGSDGSDPEASLLAGVDGALYGTAQTGGAANDGTIFRITTAGSFQLLHSFKGSDGVMPGALVQGSNGALYGSTAYGGAGFGTIFSIQPDGSLFATLYNPAVEGGGSNPSGGLAVGADGNLYATAIHGGANGFGSLFEESPAGMAVQHSFISDALSDGANPAGLSSADGYTLAGTTLSGNAYLFYLPPLLKPAPGAVPGSFRFTFAYAAGNVFRVLATTNLALPISKWTDLGYADEGPVPGEYGFTSAPVANSPQLYFTVRSH
ncbi:MAG TPA: choice-of-anchor tandem repeat GloVer-containing protein [Verrucomicrobiae bacterium]|jgi:uncharacterized repeat protein (TIGR03803 family)